jgi:hypothetical protein
MFCHARSKEKRLDSNWVEGVTSGQPSETNAWRADHGIGHVVREASVRPAGSTAFVLQTRAREQTVLLRRPQRSV